MKRKAGILSLVFALILAAIIVLPGCTGPGSPETSSPAETAAGSPSVTQPSAPVTEFGRLLSMVPYSFLQEHDIWFGDPGRALDLRGFGNIQSEADYNRLSDEEKIQARAALSGIAGVTTSSNWRSAVPLIGLDMWTVESNIFVDTPPPWGFSVIEGRLDAELIRSKLTELGYQKVEHGSQSYFSIYNDFEPNLQNPVHRHVLSALNRVAVLDDTLVTAPATDILTGVLDTVAGKQESILNNAAGAALADSLGDVLSGAIIAPDRIINPNSGQSGGIQPFDFEIPADWGKLHQYVLAGMGYKAGGQGDRFWTVSLFYNDASAASADAGTLAARMNSYILNTQFKDRGGAASKSVPLTDMYDIGQPRVQEYPGGVTLTVECRLKPETGSSHWFSFGLTTRDLLFLAPDPAPYVGAPPALSSPAQPSPGGTPLSLEEAQKQLKEAGYALAYSVDMASQLAGYPVAMPSFVPEGFVPRDNDGLGGIFVINRMPASTPGDLTEVNLIYARSADFRAPPGPKIILIQSNNLEGNVLMNNPVDIEISGHPGKKSVLPGSSGNPDTLAISWKDETRHFFLQGTLQDPLDEATLLKVGESWK